MKHTHAPANIMADLLSDTVALLITSNLSQSTSSEVYLSFLDHIVERYFDDFYQQSSPSDQWSDAEVLERIKTAPMYPDAIWTTDLGLHSSIFDLCSDTVVKCSTDAKHQRFEARALNFVRLHTSIPVPKIRRQVEFRTYVYLLLEKIEGKRLDKLWPSLSPSQRFLVAWTLRDYIRELRQASAMYPRRHIPGPMADSPQKCYDPSWLFGHRPKGPFNSSAELISYFSNSFKRQQFDDSHLVLTHGDLSLRNMIMGGYGWWIGHGRGFIRPGVSILPQ